MSIFGNKKSSLLKKAKELGLNLDENMSVFDMEKAIAEKEKENTPPAKKQPSARRGEY